MFFLSGKAFKKVSKRFPEFKLYLAIHRLNFDRFQVENCHDGDCNYYYYNWGHYVQWQSEICIELIIILTIISKCEINSRFPEMNIVSGRKSFDKIEMSIFDIPQSSQSLWLDILLLWRVKHLPPPSSLLPTIRVDVWQWRADTMYSVVSVSIARPYPAW